MSLVQVGVDYCRAHHGIRNEDADVCDFFDPTDREQWCPECDADEMVERDGAWIACPLCDGRGGTNCDLVPLFYEDGAA